MRKHTDGTEIQMIPVDRITVLNPRVRDKKKFREIVDSIAKVGLKQPIKVSPIEGQQGEPKYNLVYGQGRLEAFIALGQTEIPAIVVRLSEEDSLIMSLVENVARRHRRPTELLQGIAALKERGYTDAEIAKKTGFSTTYVSDIRHLLEAGEERLLIAVENGQMPLNVAVDIAAADDGHIQDALADAYEKGHLRGKQLIKAKRLVEQRQKFGKARLPTHPDRIRRRTSSAALVRSLQNQAERQRHVIKRAEITSNRLRFIIQGLRVLLADENFLNLLRAENMHTLPAPVAGLIEAHPDD